MKEFDLVVIGGGSGGVRAARMAATRGLTAAIVEDTHWGGTCVNVGCVPKKLMVYASHYAQDFEDARAYGWDVTSGGFDWPSFIAKKNAEIERLNAVYVRILENAGVVLFNGRGRIETPNQVRVGDELLHGKRILIATGGEPFVPNVPGAELAITSDQVFFLPRQPASCVIVGGGFIALEFACILAGMGSEVTLMYRSELFLRGFDLDLRQRMVTAIRHLGIDLRLSTDVEAIAQGEGGLRQITTTAGDAISAEQVFYATGRKPRTAGLWSDSVSINTAKSGEILVDANFQTSVPNIFALGDVVGRMALTPVALAEGMALVNYWLYGTPVDINYSLIPSAVFTQPNLSMVGMTEDQLIEQAIPYKAFETDFKHMKHSLTGRDERVYMKMLVHAETDKVLGVHAMGPDVGEMIQSVAVALQLGATKADFDRTIGIHPTMAEELVTLRAQRD